MGRRNAIAIRLFGPQVERLSNCQGEVMSSVWQEIITEFVTLFVVIDAFGAASVFLALTVDRTPAERRRIALKSVVVAAIILITFLIVGRILLSAMGISITAFQIAGGLILFLFGLSMIFDFASGSHPSDSQPSEETVRKDISVYPLAMPGLAGPGTIMTVVLLSDDDRNYLAGQAITVGVLLAVLLVTYVVFRLTVVLHQFLGETGASIVKRIMGLLLCAVAVDKALSGIADFYKTL